MNEPKYIFLQVGEEYTKEDDFKESEEVTWCTDSQFSTDILFVSSEEVRNLLKLCDGVLHSFENYAAHNKNKDEWDEYDSWLFPVWIELEKKVNEMKKLVCTETEEE